MRTFVALLPLLLILHTEGSGHGWTYPENEWSEQYPTCGGKRQSPIDIQTKRVLENKTLGPLELAGYGLQDGEFLLINNGHSIQLSLPSSMHIIGGLPQVYTAAQLHFHWGGEFHGSEHLINGVQFDSELHIVHYNSEKYGSFDEAQTKPDGLSVVTVLIQAKKGPDNIYYEKLFSHLSEIQNVGENVTLNSIDVEHMLPHDFSNFYRYQGSLTTPPCTENVIWTVLVEPATISTAQLEKLQNSIMNSNHQILQNNFREVKPLNQRRVEANFSPKKGKGKESQFRSKPKFKTAKRWQCSVN
ncbi:carbonic anhydrase 6 [Vombatus ursinus]|uniref:Carbonic anhydrase n=1 Tax=Vombatus ursinus TaxID=29139 RepID=A0A4X2MDA4_VOMUR|nr:carbonic anhydrase 6 [Vombatus ursinus]